MNKTIELTNRLEEAEKVIAQLEVVWECADDIVIKDIITEAILHIQICMEGTAQELYQFNQTQIPN